MDENTKALVAAQLTSAYYSAHEGKVTQQSVMAIFTRFQQLIDEQPPKPPDDPPKKREAKGY